MKAENMKKLAELKEELLKVKQALAALEDEEELAMGDDLAEDEEAADLLLDCLDDAQDCIDDACEALDEVLADD